MLLYNYVVWCLFYFFITDRECMRAVCLGVGGQVYWCIRWVRSFSGVKENIV